MRNPALQKLDVLLGEWDVKAPFEAPGRVWTTFEWRGDHLVHLTQAEGAQEGMPFPSTQIIGLDDATGLFTCLYTDGRGVCRVYQMSFEGDVWTIWRDAPAFHQRFTATVGEQIKGRWDFSENGEDWRTDFGLTYIPSTG
ncbi:hypothetical protein ACIBG8_40060 [Nonomuraea sp. NPDC050556]|uniref:hypothetical protein n=1 Tax=Nonomuraea sp. NPDC050556 TaxID=3364369 RepID=UPI0037B34881